MPPSSPKIRLTRTQAEIMAIRPRRRRSFIGPLVVFLLLLVAVAAFFFRFHWFPRLQSALPPSPAQPAPEIPTVAEQPLETDKNDETTKRPTLPSDIEPSLPSSSSSASASGTPLSNRQTAQTPNAQPPPPSPPSPPSPAQSLYDRAAADFNAALRDYRVFLSDKAANASLLPSIEERASRAAEAFVALRDNHDVRIPDIESLISQAYRLVSDCHRQHLGSPSAPSSFSSDDSPSSRFNRGTVGPKRRPALPPAP